MSRAPAHAGRLRPTEQFAFALVLALMAGLVVIVTVSAARSSQIPLLGGRTAAASSQTVPAGASGVIQQTDQSAAGSTPIQPASPRLSALLATALGPVLRAHPGRLAVGVIDETTGQQALYHAAARFSSGSIVTANILAALLVRHDGGGSLLTSRQAGLAAAMMDNASGTAATSLWQAIGTGNGLALADRSLKLNHTIPGAGDQWDQTRTTVADQLQLLADLTLANSPLTGPARAYELRLLRGGAIPQRWGVAAAATSAAAGSGNSVRGGALAEGQVWVVNSIGIVLHAGHVLLVAVLSGRSSSQAAGISLASAAAVAAADVMAQGGR
jgi:hypothetical protein